MGHLRSGGPGIEDGSEGGFAAHGETFLRTTKDPGDVELAGLGVEVVIMIADKAVDERLVIALMQRCGSVQFERLGSGRGAC